MVENASWGSRTHAGLQVPRHPTRCTQLLGSGDPIASSCCHDAQVYDDGSCLAAAWLWWALRVHGHPDVAVLAGGWAGWLARGEETDAGDPCCPLKVWGTSLPVR